MTGYLATGWGEISTNGPYPSSTSAVVASIARTGQRMLADQYSASKAGTARASATTVE